MSHIKMKDLLKEMTFAGGVVSQSPWVKEQEDVSRPTVNIKELVNNINNYGSLGENIYGKGSLKEVAETLSTIALWRSSFCCLFTRIIWCNKITTSRRRRTWIERNCFL